MKIKFNCRYFRYLCLLTLVKSPDSALSLFELNLFIKNLTKIEYRSCLPFMKCADKFIMNLNIFISLIEVVGYVTLIALILPIFLIGCFSFGNFLKRLSKNLIRGEKGNRRIILESSIPLSIGGFFNYLIDKAIFFKIELFGYVNNPRANLRIFSTLFTSIIVALLILFVGMGLNKYYFKQEWWFSACKQPSIINETDKASINKPEKADFCYTPRDWSNLLFAFFGLWLGLFWREKNNLHTKWEYLAGLYNDVIKIEPGKERDALKIALVLDFF